MHILIIPSEHFITESEPLGGIFQYHQAKALNNAGFTIGVLSVGYISTRYVLRKYRYAKNQKNNNINILREYKQLFFPYRYLPSNFLKSGFIQMADRLVKTYITHFGKPDLIHAHNFLYAGVISEYIKEKYGIKYIITEHSSTFARHKISINSINAIQRIAKKASSVTAVSSNFNKLLENYTNSKIGILPNLVNEYFFEKDFLTKSTDCFTFLHVGSLDKNKNQELIIKSFKKIALLNDKVQLKIAGNGSMVKYLESLVSDLNLQKQVDFLYQISPERVRHEMMNADCFILSSNFETFGVVLIEALACGLPLISTKCGGPEDIINSKNGVLVEIGNQSELEDAMAFVYSNQSKFLKVDLRNEAKERFGEGAFINNVTKYYEQGIKNTK